MHAKCNPYDAARSIRFCTLTSNSPTAASTHPNIASSSKPSCCVMERAASSALELPESNASEASKSKAPGAIEPMRSKSAVPGGTRWRISTDPGLITRQQSISGTRYTSVPTPLLTSVSPLSVSSYGKRNQSPYGPTINTPKFFQCNTTLSSPHQPMDLGGEVLPDRASNSSTFDSKFVDTTVRTELDV